MRFLDFRNTLIAFPVFSYPDILKVDPSFDRRRLVEWQQQGYIRKIVYTTNIIESLNRGIRKYTKTKSVFPDDQAAMKSVYLAISNIERKWTMPIRNWGMILQQFLIKFEDRCRI